MKFIFFGTPEVALETLKKLVEAGQLPAAVVTGEDARQGRGLVLTPTPVKKFALLQKLPVLTPARLDENFINEIAAYEAELAIVVAYGKILPESLINIFPKGVLNIHYSLLPRWRGASPMESALLHGDKVTGVTIQKMVKKLDAGDVLAEKSVDILSDDTAITLRPKLIELGANLLLDMLPKYVAGEIEPIAQDESQVTLAPKYQKADGEIKLQDDSLLNWRKYQAFVANPGVYFFENGRRMKVKKAALVDGKFQVERVVPEGGKEIDYLPS